MTSDLVRLFAEDEDGTPFVVDLFIDEAKGYQKKALTCGWWGDLKSDDLMPFIFRFDSHDPIDFGDTFGSERFGKTNLREKKIEIGQHFSLWHAGNEYAFRIRSVAPLC